MWIAHCSQVRLESSAHSVMNANGQGIAPRMKGHCPGANVLNIMVVPVNAKGKVSPAKSAAPASAKAHQGVCWKSFLQKKSDLTLLMGRIQMKEQAKMAGSEQKVKGEGRKA